MGRPRSAAAKGKAHERNLQARWDALGKEAWLYRFEDAADLYGINKQRPVRTTSRPSDYIGFYRGWTGLIEAKSCSDRKGFPVSYLREAQVRAATRIVAAGGSYFVFIENVNRTQFFVPAHFILGKGGTIPWESLLPFIWPAERKEPPL